MRFIAVGVAICFLFASTSCATVLAGDKDAVRVSSTPSRAYVRVDGAKVGRTPMTVELTRKHSHVVTVSKNGQEGSCQIGRSTGGGWIVLDLLVFGILILPWIVDIVTGAWTGLDKKRCHLDLTPDK